MLKHLPSLERVDLSGNLITTLDLASFIPLSYLRFASLDENFLRCDDKATQYLLDWLRKHSIEYVGPFCAIQRTPEMYQRMEMSLDQLNAKDVEENERLRNSSLATLNTTQVEQEQIMSLFNKTYFKRCLIMDHEFVCHLLENCKNSLNCDRYLDEQQRHTKINFYFVVAVFVIGMFIGCVLALCCCQAVVYCRVDKQRRAVDRPRRRGRRQQQRIYEPGVPLRLMNEGGAQVGIENSNRLIDRFNLFYFI